MKTLTLEEVMTILEYGTEIDEGTLARLRVNLRERAAYNLWHRLLFKKFKFEKSLKRYVKYETQDDGELGIESDFSLDIPEFKEMNVFSDYDDLNRLTPIFDALDELSTTMDTMRDKP